MLPKGALSVVLSTVLLVRVYADLPSCERAKCHHCKISFIADKCPETCSACSPQYYYPEVKRFWRPTYVAAAKQTHEVLGGNEAHLLIPISQNEQPRLPQAQQVPRTIVQQSEPKFAQSSNTRWVTYGGWPDTQTIQFKLKAFPNGNQAFPNNGQALNPTIILPQQSQPQQPQQQPQPQLQQQLQLQQQPQPLQQPQPQQQQQAVDSTIKQLPPAVQTVQKPPNANQYQIGQPQITLPQQQPQLYQGNNISNMPLSPSPQPQAPLSNPAFNPFQPFLINTFNALPGTNMSPLFARPYTPFPLAFTAATPAPVQVPQNQFQKPFYQTVQQPQYISYPVNDGHPSVNVRQPLQQNNHNQKQQALQPKSQPLQEKTPEKGPNSQLKPTQNNQQTQQNAPNPSNVPQPQNLYSTNRIPQPNLNPLQSSQMFAQPPVNPLNDLMRKPPVIQPSIDAPSMTLQQSIYEGVKPSQSQQCPRQPNWQPCISKELANERFHSCCLRLGEGCSSLCNYDATLATIQISVLTGRCPISKVGDMMVCASGNEDATPCCQAHNVFEPGFEHCKPYCNPAAGLPDGGMLTEKYKCLGKLSQIQHCFYVTQKP